MEAFLPIGFLLILALVLCAGIFGISTILGPKNPLPVKMLPFECGLKVESAVRQPFKNRFYLIAVLFLLFDVEGAFFFPWALVYRESLAIGPELLIAMLFYLFLMALGLVYIFQKKVLELN
jgi:NADH-quinone oxidoreductase subunit A